MDVSIRAPVRILAPLCPDRIVERIQHLPVRDPESGLRVTHYPLPITMHAVVHQPTIRNYHGRSIR